MSEANKRAIGWWSVEPDVDRIEYLQSLVVKYQQALEFYADPKRYLGPNQRIDGEPDKYQPEDCPYLWSVDRDNGGIARRALVVPSHHYQSEQGE